jgi:DNA polymerase-3 subunit gamma/tau
MLLKALDEVAQAPNAMMAAEMAIIRMTHVSELPSPEDLVKRLQDTPPPPPPSGGGMHSGGGARAQAMGTPAPTHGASSGPHASYGGAAVAVAVDQALARYPSFEHVIELIRSNRDVKLLVEVEGCVRLAAYQPGRIEFTPTDNAPGDLAQRLGGALQRWTGNRWAVTLVNGSDAPTIVETRDAAENAIKAQAAAHPLVKAVLDAFPGAVIEEVRTPDQLAAVAEAEALPEVEDEWDPFEEE